MLSYVNHFFKCILKQGSSDLSSVWECISHWSEIGYCLVQKIACSCGMGGGFGDCGCLKARFHRTARQSTALYSNLFAWWERAGYKGTGLTHVVLI